MTVEAFAKEIGSKALCIPCPDKEIDGVYMGDLLSWVMGRAEQNNVWITIMSNVNTVAVATLVDVACILLCEGVTPDEGVLEIAESKGVNILSTELSAYEASVRISELVK